MIDASTDWYVPKAFEGWICERIAHGAYGYVGAGIVISRQTQQITEVGMVVDAYNLLKYQIIIQWWMLALIGVCQRHVKAGYVEKKEHMELSTFHVQGL